MRYKITSLGQIFSSYVSVFILGSSYFGIVLALVTCLHPNIGISGILGLGITATLIILLKIPLHSPLARATMRNGMLAGLLIGDLFILTPSVMPFLALAVLFSLVITAALDSIFSHHKLPVISLPFCLCALIIFMIKYNLYNVAHFGNATINFSELTFVQYIPQQLLPLLRAISSILCIRDASIGLIILCIITIISPLTSLFVVAGFYIGTTAESFLHFVTSNPLLYSEGYNYSLIFTAIAGFLMVPSYVSILIACIAAVITSAVIVSFDYILHPFFLPILSLPFNFMFLTTLLSLRTLRPLWLSNSLWNTPEHTLENASLLWRRHRLGEVGVFLPTEGPWKIQQGFSGNITHRGFWKHALDFVAVDQNGQIFYNKGLELNDYISFGKPIFSPIEGHVVACLGSEPDNLIGQVTNSKNWGNYVIIKSYDGICITLAHFKQGSVLVKIGDKVLIGQKIGECGNSGYSQEPHLHLQVQLSPEIGATTIPFHLINYSVNQQIYFHQTPLVNEIVENLKLNNAVRKALDFKIGETMIFKCDGLKQETLTITHEMDIVSGRLFLTDGISRLYLAKVGAQFYFYGLEGKNWSPIWDLFCSAPKIPMTYGKELTYSDALPLRMTQWAASRFLSYIKLLFKLPVNKSRGKYTINEQGLEIKGTCYNPGRISNTIFNIDPALGIQDFSVGTNKYTRVAN